MRFPLALLAPVAVGTTLPVAVAAAEMIREPTAVIQGLDKITARVSRFDARVGEPVKFGTLLVLVRDCEKSAPEDRPENAAFVEIHDNRPGENHGMLFTGWMFSSSPALSALEHPVYDITVLDCKAPSPPPAPVAPAAASTVTPPGRSRTNSAR